MKTGHHLGTHLEVNKVIFVYFKCEIYGRNPMITLARF